jgi:hypothetical protein
MKNAKWLLFTCLLFSHNFLFAQSKTINITFVPMYGNQKITLQDSFFTNKEVNNLVIETLQFYISNLKLSNKNAIVFYQKNNAILLDASLPNTMTVSLFINNAINFDKIIFDLGIDSITNVSGALGGDLDPTKGMYWAWQSGYINCKLEGKSSLCTSRNNEFQFHLGGYQHPNYCLQTIALATQNKNNIVVKIDIEKVFSQINLQQQNHMMSPSNEAVLFSKLIAQSFSIIEL